MTGCSSFSRPWMPRRRDVFALASLLTCLLVQAPDGLAAPPAAAEGGDSHYTSAGFFDVHVCYWSDRPLFFMALFSTTRFNELQEVQVIEPDGRVLGKLDLSRYRVLRRVEGPAKHVFFAHMPVTGAVQNGWYLGRITLKDGSRFIAKDYVIGGAMPLVVDVAPADGAKLPDVPAELSWNPVPGARYYQVFIKDVWGDGQMIHTSKILTEPRLPLPPGLLQREGEYAWRVHARDTNGHILLGDFNHGSLSREFGFSIAP